MELSNLDSSVYQPFVFVWGKIVSFSINQLEIESQVIIFQEDNVITYSDSKTNVFITLDKNKFIKEFSNIVSKGLPFKLNFFHKPKRKIRGKITSFGYTTDFPLAANDNTDLGRRKARA